MPQVIIQRLFASCTWNKKLYSLVLVQAMGTGSVSCTPCTECQFTRRRWDEQRPALPLLSMVGSSFICQLSLHRRRFPQAMLKHHPPTTVFLGMTTQGVAIECVWIMVLLDILGQIHCLVNSIDFDGVAPFENLLSVLQKKFLEY